MDNYGLCLITGGEADVLCWITGGEADDLCLILCATSDTVSGFLIQIRTIHPVSGQFIQSDTRTCKLIQIRLYFVLHLIQRMKSKVGKGGEGWSNEKLLAGWTCVKKCFHSFLMDGRLQGLSSVCDKFIVSSFMDKHEITQTDKRNKCFASGMNDVMEVK